MAIVLAGGWVASVARCSYWDGSHRIGMPKLQVIGGYAVLLLTITSRLDGAPVCRATAGLPGFQSAATPAVLAGAR